MVAWKNPQIWVAILFIGVIIFIIVYFSVKGSEANPGVAWKVPYAAYPELQEIYEAFKNSCKIPEIPVSYFRDIAEDEGYQAMRKDCHELPDESKYEQIELSGGEKQGLERFMDESNVNYQIPLNRVGFEEYKVRGGCYSRTIPNEVESLATTNINKLMERLGLTNRLERQSDSRGTTYMPPGGFMEYHSNQNHHGGWRLYMHYLPEGGDSWFAYQHPYDKTYHRIYDSNEGANMFRIRRKPKRLLWHCIVADTHRFSWGIWLPPELAQHLKKFGVRQ